MKRLLLVSCCVFISTLAFGQVNSRARQLIDLERSNLVLEVLPPSPEILATENEFAAIVGFATGKDCEVASIAASMVLECGSTSLRIDRQRGWVELRDTHGYEVGPNPVETQPTAVVELLQSAFGIDDGSIQREESTLRADQLEDGAAQVTSVVRASKVFLHRRVGGLRVRAQRLVLSFANDKSLRKMIGRWSNIDFSRSQFKCELNMMDIIDRAEFALLSNMEDVDNVDSVYLESEFAVVTDEQGSYLDLRGVAVVEGHGPQGARKISRLDFDI